MNGSHNDRRRRRWAMTHGAVAVPAMRRSWWQRLRDRLRALLTDSQNRLPDPQTLPRPVYGRGGASR